MGHTGVEDEHMHLNVVSMSEAKVNDFSVLNFS